MKPELSRPLDVAALPDAGKTVEFAAGDAERAAVARRLGLLGLADLRVSGRVDVLRRGRSALLTGTLHAAVTQSCVVSLDPVEAVIEEPLRVRLLDAAEAAREAEEPDPDEDDVEILEDGAIDLGELAVQYLALALDPYPRRPDLADAGPSAEPETGENVVPGPFAVLKKLKDNA
jgi:uncharacterized metal-binding protein YceD (DUF177 family)